MQIITNQLIWSHWCS